MLEINPTFACSIFTNYKYITKPIWGCEYNPPTILGLEPMHRRENKHRILTTSARTRLLTLSPISPEMSEPNCCSVVRKRFNLLSCLAPQAGGSCCCWVAIGPLGGAPGAIADGGDGVWLWTLPCGEWAPLRPVGNQCRCESDCERKYQWGTKSCSVNTRQVSIPGRVNTVVTHNVAIQWQCQHQCCVNACYSLHVVSG